MNHPTLEPSRGQPLAMQSVTPMPFFKDKRSCHYLTPTSWIATNPYG